MQWISTISLLLVYTIEPFLWERSMEVMGCRFDNRIYYKGAIVGYYLIAVIKQMLSMLVGNDSINTIMSFVISVYAVLLTIILFDGKLIWKLINLGAFTCLAFVTELIVLICSTFIFHLPPHIYATISLTVNLFTFMSKILLIIACYFFFLKRDKKYIMQLYNNFEIIPMTLCNFIFEIPANVILRSKGLQNNPMAVSICVIIQIMLLLVTFYIFFIVKHKNIEVNNLKMELENTKRNIKGLESLRKLKHDIGGHVHIMQFLCKQKKYDELEEYMEETFKITAPSEAAYSTSDLALSIILGDLKQLALDNDVVFETSIMMDKFYMKSHDICGLIMNVVKNAIEATCKIDKEYRRVKLEMCYEPSGFHVICKNTAIKGIDFDDFVQTSKEDKMNHGYGAKIIFISI